MVFFSEVNQTEIFQIHDEMTDVIILDRKDIALLCRLMFVVVSRTGTDGLWISLYEFNTLCESVSFT